MGAEPERHLTGTSVFANAQLEFRTWGGLGHAAFWVFVRQDIYMSLLKQRPLKVDLSGWEERLSFDLGFNAATDCTWANRMIWIVAEIVSFCFGDRLSYTNWEAARAKTERWNLTRPKSFDPILYIDRDEHAKRYFPEIRLGHPWHGKFGLLSLHFHRYWLLYIHFIFADSHSHWNAILLHCEALPRGIQSSCASNRAGIPKTSQEHFG